MANLKVRLSEEINIYLNNKCKENDMTKSDFVRNAIMSININNNENQAHTLNIMNDVNFCKTVLLKINSLIINKKSVKIDDLKNEIKIMNSLLSRIIDDS